MIDLLSRLRPEPDPAVLAERVQRMLERLAFRDMLREVMRRARR